MIYKMNEGKMRLRPFIISKDFDQIKNWMMDERGHALWCANRFKFPMEKDDFESVLFNMANEHCESQFVATADDGALLGFFSYSLNLDSNEGMLKFVMVNPSFRGQGLGKQMLKLALDYAFNITKADAVHLNVFPENTGAKKCYKSIGFTERDTHPNAFAYKDEFWGRCNMIFIKKQGE